MQNPLPRLYAWYGKTTVWATLVLILALVGYGLFASSRGTPEGETAADAPLPTVTVAPAGSHAGAASVTLIGTVRAVSQAQIQAEVGGQVTSVPVALGDRVAAGAVIAQLENAAQSAAVLQAEGAYEAAVAAAAQSDVSVSSAASALEAAERTAISSVKSAYTTVSDAVYNNIDQFFASPDGSVPGLRISGQGETETLNRERIALQTLLPAWQEDANRLSASSDLDAALAEATDNTEEVLVMVDIFIRLFNSQPNTSQYGEADYRSFSATFNGLRASLVTTLASLDQARAGLESARQALERAEIGGTGTGTEVSAASAQVKQALGTLRAAQANLAKTILRSPIAGTVNTLSVSTGDFVSAFTPIAVVANNNALEITTYVGDADRETVTIGQPVTIEERYGGTITNVAPAVDPVTRKVEVKIAADTDALASGDTVRISLAPQTGAATTSADTASEPLYIPITAVKFTETSGVVFTVEDNVLVSNSVEVGDVRGAYVEITGGITPETVIVLDARGRAPGQAVEAITR